MLGDLVLEQADLVVWLDLPARVWLPRLIRRTIRRAVRRETLWSGNRETLGRALSRESVVLHPARNASARRRSYPVELAGFPTVRLRSARAVERFLTSVAGP